jgi:ATP-dependent Clp protease adaptor protein ClpS
MDQTDRRLGERSSFAAVALNRHGVTRLEVISYLVHGAMPDVAPTIPLARLVGRWKALARTPAPDYCEVVMHDDPSTKADFVVDVLMSVFNHGRKDAHALMLAIQERGTATVGTYSFAKATPLVAEVRALAQHAAFPLVVSIVPSTPPVR